MVTSELTFKDWQYRKVGAKEWKPSIAGAATTEIFPDLLANGEIPDPFLDDNEKLVQWVGESDWEYLKTFTVDNKAAKTHQLVFSGLDTFADIYINDEKVLSTSNMFTTFKVDATKYLNVNGENQLRIVFKSALLIGRELVAKYGQYHGLLSEASRVHIRKAGYHYGWDWGPELMTCGPYRPVTLYSYDSLLDDVFVNVDVTPELKANIDVQANVVTEGPVSVVVDVKSPEGKVVKKLTAETDKAGTVSQKFTIDDPDLWFPFTHGKQPLYTFSVSVANKNSTIQTVERVIGIRRSELVQEPLVDQKGTSFYIKVNNVPIYSHGSDWIPSHSFQTQLSEKDYTEWLQLMVYGNQNMIRVWGGGYYEQDIFYKECDRLGILIWHDFMFACGQFPAYPDFVENVKPEIESQMIRLRNYCSIVLWVGNNEDYMMDEYFNYKVMNSPYEFGNTTLPARLFYERILPEYVSKYTAKVDYHPGSPWGGKDSQDETVGDIHQWNVWHGKQEKYQNWAQLAGRFVSEFGMESLPCRKTYEACITDPAELYSQSKMVDYHNRSEGFERRLALYVMENIKVGGLNLDSWIYATQLMQAECLSYAYRCWRREWRGDGKRYQGGALVWQLNDCWPVASWALIDFYKRPKLAFYSVKRECSPIAVGMYRNDKKYENKYCIQEEGITPFDFLTTVESKLDIWGANSKCEDVPATLKVDFYDVTSGEKVKSLPDEEVVLKANQSTEFVKDYELNPEEYIVIHSRLVAKDGTVFSSGGDWPQPLKYLKFPNRKVDYTVENGCVKFTTNKPVKGIEIMLEKDLFIEDNGFDLFPTEEKTVKIEGLKSTDSVTIRYYEQESK